MITRYCDRAYLLDKGQIVAQGTPNTVVTKYRKLEVGYTLASSAETPLEHTLTDKPAKTRYGSDQVKIVDGGIFDENQVVVKTLDSVVEYTIAMSLEFHNTVVNPVFAFTIKDAKRTEIAGTNSHFEKISCGRFTKGQKVRVSFRQRIPLNSGHYLLSLGCVSQEFDGLNVYDRRHDFLSFQVVTNKSMTGIVDLSPTISIEVG